jgi:sugar transferase (PEP-CTERM/EpsH1 system associated)
MIRRAIRPFIQAYTAVSRDLVYHVVDDYGVRPEYVQCIYNGVDTEQFHPATDRWAAVESYPFRDERAFVVGTVGRMQPIKDQITLIRAFVRLLGLRPELRQILRLVIIGDGPLRERAKQLLQEADALRCAWLPGERNDVADMLRLMNVFVLPSLSEGMSNTILEAMATGIPVIATRVGGNAELVREGQTGTLIPPDDPVALATAIEKYLTDSSMCCRHGKAGRMTVQYDFSIEAMVNGYMAIYDRLLRSRVSY